MFSNGIFVQTGSKYIGVKVLWDGLLCSSLLVSIVAWLHLEELRFICRMAVSGFGDSKTSLC